MFDQEAKEQQQSETLTAEEIIQPVLVELREEELLEVVTGGGGIISYFRQPKTEERPLQVKLVRIPSGNLMRSPAGNLIVAIPRSLSEPSLSRQASFHENASSSSDHEENFFQHILDAT